MNKEKSSNDKNEKNREAVSEIFDLTTAQAADQLGYHPAHIRRLCEQGKLRARKIGRDWFISRASAAEIVENPPKRGPKGGK